MPQLPQLCGWGGYVALILLACCVHIMQDTVARLETAQQQAGQVAEAQQAQQVKELKAERDAMQRQLDRVNLGVASTLVESEAESICVNGR